MVFAYRFNIWEGYLWGLVKCEAGGLCIQVVFTAGLTVYKKVAITLAFPEIYQVVPWEESLINCRKLKTDSRFF